MPDYLELLRGLLSAIGPREAEAKMFPMDDRASRMIKLQREAQAPAAGSPEAKAPLTGRWYSPERREIHRLIGQATEAHPETVEVAAPQAWPEKYQGSGGLYFPSLERIDIAPTDYAQLDADMAYSLPARPSSGLETTSPGAFSVQDTLAHEQLHFLMQQLLKDEKQDQALRDPRRPMHSLRDIWERLRETPSVPSAGIKQAYGTDALQHQLIAYLLGTPKAHAILRQDTVPEPMTGTHPPAASPEIADAYRRLIYQIFPDETRRERALAGLGASRGGTLLEELRGGEQPQEARR